MASSSNSGSNGGGDVHNITNPPESSSRNGPLRVPDVFTPFPDLVPNRDAAIQALVCRKWDVKNPSGKYLGTEFVFSDVQGNGMHCVARSSIAHCVAPKLEVGNIYSLRRFTVVPNRLLYRLRRTDPHLIQLEGNTVVKKLESPPDGFVRHLFHTTPIEDITFNGNTHLIDVVGRVYDLGELKETRNGAHYVDFQLMNERGKCIKVTVWSPLAEQLTDAGDDPNSPHVILLPAMNIREYKYATQLSSTSGTAIYDSLDIPEVFNLANLLRDAAAPPPKNNRTLQQLLELGRQQVDMNNVASVTVKCLATIMSIHPRSTWYYNSCPERGCRKGLTPAGPQLWCESCEKICEYPLLRFRIRLTIADDTGSVVVTLFDETATSLVKKDVSAVMENFVDDEDGDEYPAEILQLVGTKHLLEMKSHTYYNHGEYESFTVTRVMAVPEPPMLEGVNAKDDSADKETPTHATLAEKDEDNADLKAPPIMLLDNKDTSLVGTKDKSLLESKDNPYGVPTPEKKVLKRKADSPLSQ